MMTLTTCVREAGLLSNPARTPSLVPSVMVGIIWKLALRRAFNGSEIGTLGLAGP